LWPEIPSPIDELLRAMLHKSADKRPSPAEVRAVIREMRGTPPPFDWDAPSLPRPVPRTPTQHVAPLPSAGSLARRRFRMRAGGLLLVAFGAAALTAFYWRVQVVSPLATAASPMTTALSPPATAPSPPATTVSPATTAAPAAGALVVHVDAADARIDLDGELLAQSAAGARVKVTPGEHALTVTAPGRRRYHSVVLVDDGRIADVVVHLPRVAVESAAVRSKPAARPAARAHNHDPDYLVDPFGAKR
jgi:hypothetical protein